MADKKPTWQVTGLLTDQIEINQAGNAVVGVRAYFITAHGNEGVVFLPNTRFNKDNAHAAITEQAKTLDEIGQLRGN